MSVPYKPELTYPDSFSNEPRQTSLHVLPSPPSEPNTLIDIPMNVSEGKRTVNIPLPPINFQHCSPSDVRSMLPPHKSRTDYQSIVDLPVREIDIQDKSFNNQMGNNRRENFNNNSNNNSNNNFGITLSENIPIKKGTRQQKSYRPINESQPMTKFLYRN